MNFLSVTQKKIFTFGYFYLSTGHLWNDDITWNKYITEKFRFMQQPLTMFITKINVLFIWLFNAVATSPLVIPSKSFGKIRFARWTTIRDFLIWPRIKRSRFICPQRLQAPSWYWVFLLSKYYYWTYYMIAQSRLHQHKTTQSNLNERRKMFDPTKTILDCRRTSLSLF